MSESKRLRIAQNYKALNNQKFENIPKLEKLKFQTNGKIFGKNFRSRN